jgi:serralysin
MSGSRDVALTGNALIDPLLSRKAWNSQTISVSAPDTGAGWGAGYPWTYETDPDGAGPQPPITVTVNETTGFQALNDLQRAALRAAMREIESFTELTLNWNTASPLTADIRVAMTTTPAPRLDGDATLPGIQWTAIGIYPGTGRDGDSWFNTTDYNDPVLGTFAYQTFFHELGHTLGLKHPHPETVNGVANTPVLPEAWDSLEFATMTYRESIGDTDRGYQVPAGHFPQSYMMLDILALQTMYGADFTTNAGATVWRFDPNTGQTFRDNVPLGIADDGGAPNATPLNILFRTIWDGGGNDTYDFSAYLTNLSISLEPGGWTDTDRDGTTQAALIDLADTTTSADDVYARGQVFNALLYRAAPNLPYDNRSLIENAIGGFGHDIIFGNLENNRLEGRDGNDTLEGFAGFDTLNGGLGRDAASWLNAPGGVTVNLLTGQAFGTGSGGTDQLISIEDVFGSGFADNITGDNGDNALFGFGGNDVINGRGGNDTIDGGAGNDLIVVTAGLNVIDGGPGNDTIRPGADPDAIHGGDGLDTVDYSLATSRVIIDRPFGGGIAGHAFGDTYTWVERFIGTAFDDIIKGNATAETLEGGDGNDWLEGGFGNDRLIGGRGIDTLLGGAGADTLDGGDDYDGAWFQGDFVLINLVTGIHGGAAAGDVFLRIESFLGTDGHDSMLGNGDPHDFYGGAGNDTLDGGAGNDKLFGGAGDDVLYGGFGDDALYGGGGNDEYWGGDGFDLVSFADLAGPVFIDFAPGAFGNVLNPLKLVSIEDIEGTRFADAMWGRADEANYFRGGAGNDTIGGRGGADLLDGEGDDDVIVVHGLEWRANGDGGGAFGNFDELRVGGTAGVFNWATNSFAVDGKGILQVLGFEMARGGAGGDRFTADWQNLSFYGEGGADTLTGGSGDNVLEGGEGADRLFFGGGFDYADYRSDTTGVLVDIRAFIAAFGHAAGDLWLDAPEGLMGGSGNDSLGGSDFANRLLGRAGNDYISAYGGDDTVEGGDGADSLEGGFGADIVIGGDGADILSDNQGILLPSEGDDGAEDSLYGGNGHDTLLAGAGADLLDGGADDDLLTGGAGADLLIGGAGHDVLADHTQRPEASGALLSGAYAATDADTLLGGGGDDQILASGGGDLVDGGDGIDNLLMDFTGTLAALVFTMRANGASFDMTLGGVVTAAVRNVETLLITAGGGRDVMNATAASFYVVLDGGDDNDVVRGGASGDVLIGSGGNDRLHGNGGDDLLVGGAGRDTMEGGAGRDLFRWDVAAEARDVILDFRSGEDRLWVDASGFKGGLRENMDLAATGRFVAGGAATAARGQFLYDQATGTLLWDVDGTGTRASVLIAELGAGTTLAASDFLIVA